jgi:hypothetical protein
VSHPQLIHDGSGESLDIGQPGGALATSGDAEATYRSNPGQIERDETQFAFAGTNEVFSAYLGRRTRTIDWRGTLRLSASGLASVRASQDEFSDLSGTFTFVDDDGTEYAACRIKSFMFGQKERIHQRGQLIWVMDYAIVIEQLEP